jgi:hypothetical protein
LSCTTHVNITEVPDEQTPLLAAALEVAPRLLDEPQRNSTKTAPAAARYLGKIAQHSLALRGDYIFHPLVAATSAAAKPGLLQLFSTAISLLQRLGPPVRDMMQFRDDVAGNTIPGETSPVAGGDFAIRDSVIRLTPT